MVEKTARNYPKLPAITLLAAFLWAFSSPAQAHRVTVFAWVDGDTVHTQSKFGAGQKVQGGEILVLDEAGNHLLTGKTDDNGEFSFPIPQQSALKIVLLATMGHRAEWSIPITEMTGAEMPPPAAGPPSGNIPEPQTLPEAAAATEDLEKIVEKVLERKLQPIHRLLAEIRQEGPSFRDIFGGIGYIFGLVGVAAYFRCRKQTPPG